MSKWLVIGLLITNFCWASPTKKTDIITIGIFPTFIHDMDYANESYNISFYVWMITKDPNYDPRKRLEITNAYNYTYKNYTKDRREDGSYLHTMHVYSTIYHDWKVKYFPFDKQILTIRIEDSQEINVVTFIPDKKQSTISNQFNLEDWQIEGLEVKTIVHPYNSSLGSYDGGRDTYSQFVAELTISRHGARLFFNFYIGFIVSFMISACVFFIEPSEIRPRASFTLAALFGAVGNKYIIDRFLPVVDHFTLNDAIQIAAFGLILTTAFTTIITYRIQRTNSPRADKINKYVGYTAVPMFIIFYLFFFIVAING